MTSPAPDGADAPARRRAAIIAGHTGAVDAARRFLTDTDEKVRAAALGALDRLGVLAPADLDTAIGDESPTVRRRAASLGAGRACARQYELLTDADPAVIEVAAWACGEREHDAEAVARLVAIGTGHDEALCREAAIAALGALGDPAGLDAILAGCSDKPAIRRRAVLALAPFDGPAVDAALVAATEDRDWQTRQAAETLLRPPMASDDEDDEPDFSGG